jgi:peptidoglycan hydrolase CwlO-like protein/surface antigen
MKQRSTTPVSKGLVTRSTLVATVVLMVIAGPLSVQSSVYADQYDDQISALQAQINQAQTQADQLHTQAATLQDALNELASQQNTIQAQIDLSQAKLDQLQQQIVDTQQKITDNQAALGSTLADLYVGNTISPLEMLASSKNISDYVDKQTYQDSMSDSLTQTISTITTLKKSLNAQKVDVQNTLADQNAQKSSLVANENQQQQLLNQTQGQEAAYQQQVSSTQNQLAQVAAQQRAAIAALTDNGHNTAGSVGSFQFRNFSGNQGACGGGYPAQYCNAPLDSGADQWQLYNRECVSYAAWAAYYRFGKDVRGFQGQGFAWQWPSSAPSFMNADVDNTPTVGSIAITPQESFTPEGHAMVVEAVLGDGWIHVSQYNFDGTGEYSTMDLKISSAVYVHFKDR